MDLRPPVNPARQDDVRMIFKRAIDFDRDAALSDADLHEFRCVVSIVVEHLDSLKDEGSEQLALFCCGYRTVNARGKDDVDVGRGDS